jgi:hypothetical protein
MSKFIPWSLLIIIFLGIGGYMLWVYSFGNSFMKSYRYTDAKYFHIANRLKFNVPYKGEILDSLLISNAKTDTSYTIHENLTADETPDSSAHCWCYCGNYTTTLKFNNPKEIYLVTYDFGEHTVGIDWVIQFKNSKWTCHPTSKLDSTQKNRIENRFKSIVAKFPIEDTGRMSNTWRGHSVDYDFGK